MYCLPEEFRLQHDFCMYLHNFIVKMIVNGEKEDLFLTKFEIPDKGCEELLHNDDVDIWDWLIKNDRKDVLSMVCIKNNFVALMSDFCQYVFTALDCSTSGKLSVSYTLLRKPFKDILFLIEWMVANPKEFSELFIDQDIDVLAVEKLDRLKKLEIINIANENSVFKTINAEYLYNVRYDKKCDYGLEGLFQMANHIITSNKNYKTENSNLNFIFSSLEDKVSQWNALYLHLPLLMMHTLGVCNTLYMNIGGESIADIDLERICNMFLEVSKLSCDNEISKQSLHKVAVPLTCEKCSTNTKPSYNWLKYDEKYGYWFVCKNGHQNHIF